MCNCIEQIPSIYHKTLNGEYRGKPIERISLKNVIQPMRFKDSEQPLQAPKIAVVAEIHREGVKRVAEEMIVASYCPFCGEKYMEKSDV